MEISAVTQILKYVVFFSEWGLANPLRTLPAHLGKGMGFAVHPRHHVMATNTTALPSGTTVEVLWGQPEQ